MYMNWGQHESSPALQGVPKGQFFSQEQGRIPVSMAQVPQQLDGSLYGTPIPNLQGNLNRHAHPQGNSLFKAIDNPSPKPTMQSSALNTSFFGGQAFGRQNPFNQVPIQDNNARNYQQVENYSKNVNFQEFIGQQEGVGLSGIMQGNTTQISSTQSSVSLDPLEQKILFGMNNNAWDPSFDCSTDPGMGSWSALMLSAVEDEPNGGTALQEQWSGFTFNLDSGKQNTGSIEKPFLMGNDSNFFPGFQPPNFQFPPERKEAPQSASQISIQSSHKNAGNWLSGNIQQTLSVEGSQQAQHIEASRQFSKNHHVDCTKSIDNTTRHTQNENTANDLRDFSNGPQVLDKSDHGGGRAYGKHLNNSQRENSIDRYNSNTFQHANTGDAREYVSSSARDYLRTDTTNQESHKQVSQRGPNYGQGFFGQLNGNLPEFQGNSKASEDLLSRGSLGSNISDSFDRSIGLNTPNHTAQTSRNMHELYQTVDYSRKDGVRHLGTVESQPSTHSLKAESANALADQLYNQSSVSQGFGLRLAPPFERIANANLLQFSQSSSQIGSNLNERHVNQELGENSQGRMTPSERASQIEPQDGKLSSSGQMEVRSSHMNMQGASPSQIQSQHGPNAPVPFQSFLAFPGPASRFLPSNLGPSQDTSRLTNFNSLTQEFPVLEAVPVPQQPSIVSSMSEHGELSAKLHNVWTKIPIHRLSSNAESQKVYSTDSLNNSHETTSFASEAQNEQTSHLDGNEESEISTSLRDQQVMDYGKGKQSIRSQHPISSKIQDSASQTGKFLQGPQSAPMHLQGFNRVWQDNNQSPGSLSLEANAHSLRKSDVHHQNQSLLQHAQVTTNVETRRANSNLDPQQLNVMTGQRLFNGQSSRIGNQMSNELNAMPHLQPGARLNDATKALTSQPLPNSHSPHMASFPFLQYGNISNGQMMSLSDPTNVAVQFEKSRHGIHTHASDLQVDSAMASQIDGVLPSAAATLAVNDPSSTPFVSSSDAIDQSLVVTRPNKRKTATSELVPWNQEVIESSQRLHNISMAQIEWAQATNRLTEKVDYRHIQIEDGNPLLRSKKRLILTTQLIQHLLHPPPAAFFSADATSGFDSVAYCVARFALGDACSMASCKRSDYLLSQEKNNITSEKQSASERVGDLSLSKVIEGFTVRAKKLENDLLRLDKKASTVDLLVECQDLDKFSIINRFAKFHVRAPDTVDNSSNPSRIATPSKMYLQRYVSAFPMPSRLPDGVHCLSL